MSGCLDVAEGWEHTRAAASKRDWMGLNVWPGEDPSGSQGVRFCIFRHFVQSMGRIQLMRPRYASVRCYSGGRISARQAHVAAEGAMLPSSFAGCDMSADKRDESSEIICL